MAANLIWAIDIGHSALRAVKARRAGDLVQVLSLDVVEYRQSLAAPGVDRDLQIQQAVHTFVARNDVRGCGIVVVMPAPNALIRFIQLPPVDRSAIADIVQYEARQQIPFPLEEVCWDHAAIDRGFVPGENVEVGLFALRKELAFALLNCVRVGGLDPDILQLPLVSLYNFVIYERPPGRDALMVMDMGEENTHLLCMNEDTVWVRSLPLGGHAFAQAIQKALGIEYSQAEAEKRNARKSARAQEIAQAIDQPMTRFVEEIQRSVGYFNSLHSDVQISGILALGGGFRLPGLARSLQEATGIEVHGLSSLSNYDLSRTRNVNQFKKQATSFAVALGAAAQGLGIRGTLNTTMLPAEVVRQKIISRKKPYVAAAAALILSVSGILYASARWQNGSLRRYEQQVGVEADALIQKVQEVQSKKGLLSVDKALADGEALTSIFSEKGLWIRVLDELTKPIPPEPANEHIWLTEIGSGYVDVTQAAAGLVAPPVETGGPGRGGRPRGIRPSGVRRRGGGIGEPGASAQVPDQVLSVVVSGEARHPDRGAFVQRAFVDKLNESPLFSFAQVKNLEASIRVVDKVTGQVLAVAGGTARERGGRFAELANISQEELPEGLERIEYTKFVVEVYIDPDGKLAKAVEDMKKLYAGGTGGAVGPPGP